MLTSMTKPAIYFLQNGGHLGFLQQRFSSENPHVAPIRIDTRYR